MRVILDYEIKRNLNRDLALLGPEKDNLDRKAEVAEKHGLEMVNGKDSDARYAPGIRERRNLRCSG